VVTSMHSTYGVHIPAAIDTARIRKTLKLTQQHLPPVIKFRWRALRDWEQGRRMPDAPARALIQRSVRSLRSSAAR